MTGDVASKTEPSAPAEQRVPTGYRVNLLPGALEICARLGTPEEVRNLIKVLRAGILILQDTIDSDMDAPMTFKTAAKVGVTSAR
jgi:hypothetical protein